MKKTDFPFLLFGAFFVLTIPWGSGMATSVVPGWHTAILAPNFISMTIISISLLFVTIGYRRLIKKINKVSLRFFLLHTLLTIPVVLLIRTPFLLLNLPGPDLNLLGRQVTFATAIVATSLALFFVGLTLFGIYFIKNTFLKTRAI